MPESELLKRKTKTEIQREKVREKEQQQYLSEDMLYPGRQITKSGAFGRIERCFLEKQETAVTRDMPVTADLKLRIKKEILPDHQEGNMKKSDYATRLLESLSKQGKFFRN